MSGICGLLHLDGAPIAPETLQAMAMAAAYRGPDGIDYWMQGSVGLAYLAFHTTPESLREHQPLVSQDGHLVLVADGRVDNRTELIAQLRNQGGLRESEPTDADLLLAAYGRWGEQCPVHILGDFAFVVWDQSRHKLFCARDPIGVRQFFYHYQKGRFVFGSCIAMLLAALNPKPTVHWPLLQDLVAGEFKRWISETAYQDLQRLPPAHALTVDAQGVVALTHYWRFGAQAQPRYRRDEEYIEHFRALFQEAVRVHARSCGPLGVLVGGLDSSSVACTLHELATASSDNVPTHLYAAVFDHTPAANEREYGAAVARTCARFAAHFIPSDQSWGLREFGGDQGFPLDEPEIGLNRLLLLHLLRAARQDGVRVALMGWGADQLLREAPYSSPPLLRDLPLRHWPFEIQWFQRWGRLTLGSVLARAYLGPLLPTHVKVRLQRWLQPAVSTSTARLCQRSAESFNPAVPLLTRGSQAARQSHRSLTQGVTQAWLSGLVQWSGYAGVELRHPFLYRPLIEFMLALPSELVFRNGLNKYILRQALQGVLPETVRQRPFKVHFTELDERGLREMELSRVHELLQNSRLVAAGMVRSDALSRNWESYFHQDKNSSYRTALAHYLCTEAWLRATGWLSPA